MKHESETDAVRDSQSGERILGRSNLQALRSHHPGKPSGFEVKRILGNGLSGITEYTITYQGRLAHTVSIMEFRNGRVVNKTQYFGDPFELPAWRRQWVQQMARGRTEDEEICLTDSRLLGNCAHGKFAAIVTEGLRPNAG